MTTEAAITVREMLRLLLDADSYPRLGTGSSVSDPLTRLSDFFGPPLMSGSARFRWLESTARQCCKLE